MRYGISRMPDARRQPGGRRGRRTESLQVRPGQPSQPRSGRQPAVASVWMRPPELPAKYIATARVSDMIHGWLDGKRGVPALPDQDSGPAGERPGSEAGTAPDGGWEVNALRSELLMAGSAKMSPTATPTSADDVSGWTATGEITETETSESAAPLDDPLAPQTKQFGLWTPRMEILVLQSYERIEEERIRLAEDLTLLRQQANGAWQSVDALTERVKSAGQALERARVPLRDQERVARRLAEQSPRERPDQLVISRRDATWAARLRLAEQEHQIATAELAQASQLLRTHQDSIRERIEVARAAARRQYELGRRRVATYLQQLVRTHAHGRQLNDLFMEHRVGPELPGWTRDQAEG